MLSRPPTVTAGAGALLAANNLSDIASASAARTSIEAMGAADLAAARNALAPRGGVWIDSPGRVNAVLTGQAPGIDPFSSVVVFGVPATTSAARFLIAGSSSASNPDVDPAWQFYFMPGSATLRLQFRSAALGTRNLDIANFATTYASKVVMLTLVRSGTTVTVYCNSVALTTETNAAWAADLTATHLLIGSHSTDHYIKQAIASVSLYNLALTAADALEIYELGGAVPERYKFGSQASNLVVNGDFASGSGWTLESGWSISGGLLVATAAGNSLSAYRYNTALQNGKIYRAKFTLASYVAGLVGVALGSTSGTQRNADGTYTQEITVATAGAGLLAISTGGGGPHTFTVDDFSIYQLGAVVHLPLDDGYSFLLKDQSANKLHAVMTTTGVSHVLPQNRPHHIRGTTSTNGNQQLWGQALIPAYAQITRARARAQSGTPTITLGTASGGSQIVASVALSTTWKDLTIALTGGILSADTSIWVGSNSTDVVEIDLTCEPLSA